MGLNRNDNFSNLNNRSKREEAVKSVVYSIEKSIMDV